MTHDVIIVGAGIVGLACAAVLQAEGRRVLLLDRTGPAEETSRGNAGAFAFSDILPLASPGILRKAPGWLFDPLGPLSIPPAHLPRITPWLLRFQAASRPARVAASARAQGALMGLARDAMGRLVLDLGLEGHVRRDGSLEVYESEAALRAAGPGWAAREAAGIPFEHVRGARLAELQPGLAKGFVAGTFVPGWETVADPYEFARAIFRAIEAAGGAFERAAVTAVAPREGGVHVHLADGSVREAAQAVIAAGAWSRPLAASLGDRVPLETERGYNTTLPADAFPLRRQIIFGGHGFVATPLATGLRVGGAVELGGLTRPPNFARADAMLTKAARFLPGLRTEGGRQWMGFRPSLPDSLPVIGPAAASPAIVYAFGHGHLGLTQSAATGRLVADMLARRAPAIDPAPFSAARFR